MKLKITGNCKSGHLLDVKVTTKDGHDIDGLFHVSLDVPADGLATMTAKAYLDELDIDIEGVDGAIEKTPPPRLKASWPDCKNGHYVCVEDGKP